ncbi:MAG TPA: hypothetical protein VG899_12840 [Mycobacteriales bacterium]|nr:hypothetical protein [Mycobacteriales bacterium]
MIGTRQGYVALLEAQRRELEDRMVKVAAAAGALHLILVHSRDKCATVEELRAADRDLMSALGVPDA